MVLGNFFPPQITQQPKLPALNPVRRIFSHLQPSLARSSFAWFPGLQPFQHRQLVYL